MNNAPVIIFVYNRADHFMSTCKALADCHGAKETELYIFSDGAKNEGAAEGVRKVREEAQKIKKAGAFKSVTITESEANKGLARSVIDGVTQVIEKYGRAIVVEDDCVATPYFLEYMNSCLEYFEADKTIGAISGYTPAIDFPKNYDKDIFTAYRSCSWTWATWKDRWQGVDWELYSIADFYKSPKLIKRLNSNGSDRFLRLYRQTKGNGSSWSVRFGAHLVKNAQLTVYPRYSYISNIGCDESGVHSMSDDAEKMKVDPAKAIAHPKIEAVKLNTEIQKTFKKHYSYGLVSDIKRFAATVLIVAKEIVKG
ncbi:MAG: sugar transferase [Clostridia bacterium]|nr:sugar transferase [Clostridia bacterium]